jgi:lysophospholipase L1-like esterase
MAAPNAGAAASAAAPAGPAHAPLFIPGYREAICLFGDSITQDGFDPVNGGWVAGLANYYRRKADVINRGMSGYNTRLALLAAPHILGGAASGGAALPASASAGVALRGRFLLSTVFFGANDAAVAGEPQHVPLAEYEANLTALVAMARAASTAVAVISPPPLDSARWPNRGNMHTVQYAAAAGRVAAAAAAQPGPPVVFVELFESMQASESEPSPEEAKATAVSKPTPEEVKATVELPAPACDTAAAAAPGASAPAPGPAYHRFLCDGLHLSRSGNAFLLARLIAALEAGCPAATPDALTIDFRIWRDMDLAVAPSYFSAAGLAELHAEPRPIFK